jgi:hypothetical protein
MRKKSVQALKARKKSGRAKIVHWSKNTSSRSNSFSHAFSAGAVY